MKKLLALLFAAIIFFATIGTTDADAGFYIAYAFYDGLELFGEVETPNGDFFIRATFFLSDEQYFVLVIPISREGLFQADIAVFCENISIAIVDSPSFLIPETGGWHLSSFVLMI